MTRTDEDTRQGMVTVKVRAQRLEDPYISLIVISQTNEGEGRQFKTILQNIDGRLSTMGHFGGIKINNAGFKGVFRHVHFTDDPSKVANISTGARAHRLDWEWKNAGIIIDLRRATANGQAVCVHTLMSHVARKTRHGATIQEFIDTVVSMTDSPVQFSQVVRERRQALIDEICENYCHRQIFATLGPDERNLYRAHSAAALGKRLPEGHTRDRRYEAGECLKAVLIQRPGQADEILTKVVEGLEGANKRPVVVKN